MATQPAKLQREQIDALLYGGKTTPRFTQDSPVLPDVWIKYAEEPQSPHELLLTPYHDPRGNSCTAGELSRVLKACLALDETRRPRGGPRKIGGGAAVAYNQATVLARLWFDELVRVVLPLSAWWYRLGAARRAAPPQEPEVGTETKSDSTARPEEPADRRRRERADMLRKLREPGYLGHLVKVLRDPRSSHSELSPDLLWMVNVIGSIGILWHEGPLGPPPTVRPWPMEEEEERKLQGDALAKYDVELDEHYRAVVDRVIYLTDGLENAPWGAKNVSVDRPLLWSVSLNRQASSTIWRSRATVKADAATRVFDISCRELAWAIID